MIDLGIRKNRCTPDLNCTVGVCSEVLMPVGRALKVWKICCFTVFWVCVFADEWPTYPAMQQRPFAETVILLDIYICVWVKWQGVCCPAFARQPLAYTHTHTHTHWATGCGIQTLLQCGHCCREVVYYSERYGFRKMNGRRTHTHTHTHCTLFLELQNSSAGRRF